jgi:hypothetical protein
MHARALNYEVEYVGTPHFFMCAECALLQPCRCQLALDNAAAGLHCLAGWLYHAWMDGSGAGCNGRALLALHIMNFCIRSAMEPVVHNFMQVMHASHRPLSVSFQQLVSH